MSKRADDASPSGKSDDDEGSSGDGEPSSPLEPSEAFKRPRLASDARKPIQTRAREPRPLIWRDTAEESDAPPQTQPANQHAVVRMHDSTKECKPGFELN